MARFCSQCGTEIQTGSKFCMKCGKNIESDLEESESVQNSSVSVAQDKSAGNNKLIPILIIALIVIGCIGGYFFLKRSSDVKKSTAQSQTIETQQTEKSNEFASAPKPVEKPKTVAPPIQQFRVDQSSARNAFISFHGAITNRQLANAYNILSPHYQKFMRSYDNFARGYETTLRSDIVELNTVREDPNSATYTYKLKAVDREGNGTKTQYFAGKATLIRINGLWRLDSTEAKRL